MGAALEPPFSLRAKPPYCLVPFPGIYCSGLGTLPPTPLQGRTLRVLVPPSRCGWVPPKKGFAFANPFRSAPRTSPVRQGLCFRKPHAPFPEGRNPLPLVAPGIFHHSEG